MLATKQCLQMFMGPHELTLLRTPHDYNNTSNFVMHRVAPVEWQKTKGVDPLSHPALEVNFPTTR